MAHELALARRRIRATDLAAPGDDALLLDAPSEQALALRAADEEEAKGNLEFERAEGTLATYANEWKQFERWAATRERATLPASAETIRDYVADLGTRRRPAGIAVAISAISWEHRQAGLMSQHRNPIVLAQFEAVRRRRKVRPNQKSPLVVDLLRKIVAVLPDTPEGKRDRAILLVCFAGAFRRSELVSLDVPDFTIEDRGMRILLRESKTDQTGEGMVKTLLRADDPALCPVAALQGWLEVSGIVEGPVFRSLDDARESRRERNPDDRLSGRAIARIVKARLRAANVDPKDYSGHSPRAGLVTSSALAGHDVFEIMATTGHTNVDTLAKYVRQVQAYDRNATKGLL